MVIRIRKKPEEELDYLTDSVLDPHSKPVATIEPGEIVEIETWSALSKVVNPVTGPIEIKEAKPGDTLLVEVLQIELPEQGTVAIIPGFGSLEGWLRLLEPKRKNCAIKDGIISYHTDHGTEIKISADPFIGTIGVSPGFEALSSL